MRDGSTPGMEVYSTRVPPIPGVQKSRGTAFRQALRSVGCTFDAGWRPMPYAAFTGTSNAAAGAHPGFTRLETTAALATRGLARQVLSGERPVLCRAWAVLKPGGAGSKGWVWRGRNDGVANSLRSGGFPFWGRDRIRTRLPILRCYWPIPLGVPSCGTKCLTGLIGTALQPARGGQTSRPGCRATRITMPETRRPSSTKLDKRCAGP
jgi:hypothetical protein